MNLMYHYHHMSKDHYHTKIPNAHAPHYIVNLQLKPAHPV
jgi:hypothetical protein